MDLGIYESLITQSLYQRLNQLNTKRYFILADKKVDVEEAVYFLSLHLAQAISNALKQIRGAKTELVSKQIEVSNNILKYMTQQIENYDFNEDLILAEGKILEAVFDKLTSNYHDFKIQFKEMMPTTRLTQSELFTGGNVGLSLDSELKKEIRSADRIDLLVSFIKWKAVVILKTAFEEFTARGGKLRVLTTTYMGASDAKAIHSLSQLNNTEIKVSYNNANERLHAKAYLFYRNTGYHTGYIGSSNFSRSALTDGLEWNVKITTKEIPHIIDKFQKTFESYWSSKEFIPYNPNDDKIVQQLSNSLLQNRFGRQTEATLTRFFDLEPYHYQEEILEKLKVERTVHQSFRNLIVAATGTGKTMISAFDFKRYKQENPSCKFLFIAHRIEILKQSLETFRHVLKDQNFGELLGGGYEASRKDAVFATVQSFNNLNYDQYAAADYYDFIIFDEVHHAQAVTYQKIIQYFKPQILVGLTATPERMDGKSILPDFNFRFAAEIRLPDALNQKILCPFQYFGISDSIDYSKINWRNGKYDVSELTNIFTANDARVRDIINNIDKYTKDLEDVSCLGFCVGIEHAKFMHRKFEKAGLKSNYLVSENSHQRKEILEQFKKKEINYLFVVDIFNEGVDIPEIDTVLFLRPTESLTIFLQQLGRGLRLHEGKDVLTVLDIVGRSREEYDFENKFRALIGKTNTSVSNEIEKDFPNLPLGSSIILEKQAKEHILENIRKATAISKTALLARFQRFTSQTHEELSLENFLKIYNLRLSYIYKHHTFSALKAEALHETLDDTNYARYKSMFSTKWMVTESFSYFNFILQLIANDFDLTKLKLTNEQQTYVLMLYYDFYQQANQSTNLHEAIREIGKNAQMVEEMKAFLHYKIDKISFEEIPYSDIHFPFPLQIHARYTRDQILVALGLSTYTKQSSNREGVALNKALNTEALFINLKKTEEDFSPTTMYDDYAINETLFHWQSQNATSPESEKGQSYIAQAALNKRILLFVREATRNADGFTEGYVFLGPAQFVSFKGSKPMSIKWELSTPIPNYLWKESAKLMVG